MITRRAILLGMAALPVAAALPGPGAPEPMIVPAVYPVEHPTPSRFWDGPPLHWNCRCTLKATDA
jgi:hypothetical protein